MPTRNVVLTDYHEKLIEELVSSGRYQNASEVLRAGLRLVELEKKVFEEKLKRLREAVRTGFDDIARGDYLEFHSAEELQSYLLDRGEAVIREASDQGEPGDE